MMMTAEEICRHYRQAADQKRDIQVLAELNLVSRDTIRAVLVEGGELAPAMSKRLLRDHESQAALAEAIAAGLDAGMNNQEIADMTGCCPQTVKNHRRRHKAATIKAAGEEQAKSVYARMEQIIAAVPRDASEEVRRRAGELCVALAREIIGKRLEVVI